VPILDFGFWILDYSSVQVLLLVGGANPKSKIQNHFLPLSFPHPAQHRSNKAMKIMVYSHDAFGLGNIRRMLAICQYLIKAYANISILVVSGSPAIHSLRLPQGLDYIKLPCIGRDESGAIATKFLNEPLEDSVQLRSDVILSAVKNFKPDLLLVDKRPDGLQGELMQTLDYLKFHQSETKLVLLLRDILDRPEVTIPQWQNHNYYEMVERLYDQIWVVGMPEIFDVRAEYRFPLAIARKVKFCGYIRREPGLKTRREMRQELQIQPDQKFVLVTPGGGGDGYRLVETYLNGLASRQSDPMLKSLIISGPEMPEQQRQQIQAQIASDPNISFLEFSDDIVSYMDAADVVVSMAGYNTIGEILSLRKRAIVVPRSYPVEEQWIRAERMAEMGLFRAIHSDDLTPERLIETLAVELGELDAPRLFTPNLDMNALPRIAESLSRLIYGHSSTTHYADVRTETCLAIAEC
jgi:predicted glycosyltransferase